MSTSSVLFGLLHLTVKLALRLELLRLLALALNPAVVLILLLALALVVELTLAVVLGLTVASARLFELPLVLSLFSLLLSSVAADKGAADADNSYSERLRHNSG